MSTILNAVPSPALPRSHALAILAMGLRGVRAVAKAVRVIGHRRDIRILLDFDERALKDIGLVRNDVVGALSQPLMHDPSLVLMSVADRRLRSPMMDVGPRSARPFRTL